VLTHVVLFKLHDPARAPEVREKLLSMKGKIPDLLDIEVGVDVVRSERSYDVALITKHESLAAMERYQVHPVHEQVIAYMKTVRDRSVAVDFES
jgi:hypothetical protein